MHRPCLCPPQCRVPHQSVVGLESVADVSPGAEYLFVLSKDCAPPALHFGDQGWHSFAEGDWRAQDCDGAPIWHAFRSLSADSERLSRSRSRSLSFVRVVGRGSSPTSSSSSPGHGESVRPPGLLGPPIFLGYLSLSLSLSTSLPKAP